MVKDPAVRHYLADALCEALFCQPGPTRLWVILQALPKDLTCAPERAEETMGEDSRFRRVVTRWDLAHRASASSRPLGGALEAILQAYGRPMPRSLLISELCLSRPGNPPQFDELLERLLLSGRDLGSFGGCLFLTKWLPDTSAADDDSRLFLNGLADDTQFLALRTKLNAGDNKQRNVLDTAEAVLKIAKEPLSNRALGLVLAHHHGERFNAVETLTAMHADPRFLRLSGPAWTLATQEKSYLRTLARVKAEVIPPPQVDLQALLQTKPLKIKIADETLQQATELAAACRTPVDLEELLTDLLQLQPRQRNFGPSAHVLEQTLSSDSALLRLSPGRYLSHRTLPPWVSTVPEALVPEVVLLAPRERSKDIVLPLEQLAPGLAEHVLDPFYEDEGEAGISAEPVDEVQTAVPIASHHRRCGTMKLRARDRDLFDQQGPIALVTFVTPAGERLPVWVNQQTRLLYGLLKWYDDAALPPCGALVTINRDLDDRDVYHLVYKSETDGGTYIGRDRLAQLDSLRDRLRRKRPFLVDIIKALLQGSDKGLPFDQIWSQVNVIRRTTRQLVASTLTVNEQFAESGGRWRLM
ncbi:MAG: hypothetical protein ACYC63_02150 [Armatimonadota bacterium]